ncbi:MAG TPA: anti-sigma F factor antagonist [Peptococcaceae bacterium]|nr:MAG: Anti-sigma F factor antagonist [Clostridia bacterium 41_269]HBT20474.1 anti-sigma F factor antagonist [Peptococcaceae bacterium]
MKIQVEKLKDTLFLRLKGEFDMLTADEFRSAVDDHFDGKRVKNLILDISKVSFIDSSGLGAILARYKKIKQLNGNMVIVGAKPQVKRVLELSGVVKIIEVYDDEKSALMGLL